jgi:eukaryotic-like serine/threonine-protein kinase
VDKRADQTPCDPKSDSGSADFSLADAPALLPSQRNPKGSDHKATPVQLSHFLEENGGGELEQRTDVASQPGTDLKPEVTMLGDFLLVKKIGEGGMGTVYEAQQLGLDRVVALKVPARHLTKDKRFVKRFQREARVMGQLDHPHILRCFTFGEAHGYHYLAMELASAGSLDDWIERLGQLSVADSLHVIIAAAAGLQHAHDQNLVHRDIKPGNILITGKGVVKVSDMGLAKAMTEADLSLTRSGTGIGTPVYMPPEQMRDSKNVDARYDIYALGCVLYHCLTGRPPFRGESYIELFEAKEHRRYAPARSLNRDVPPRLEIIIEKALEKDPKHRYQTCTELIQELEGLNLANPGLSFVTSDTTLSDLMLTPVTHKSTTKSPAKSSPPPTAAAKPSKTSEWWYVRAMNFDGVRRLTRQQIVNQIQNSEFDLKAEASRLSDSGFQPLLAYGEFEPSVRARVRKLHLDMKTARYKGQMAALLKEEEKYEEKQQSEVKLRQFSLWLGPLLVFLLLSGLGYAIYLVIKAFSSK